MRRFVSLMAVLGLLAGCGGFSNSFLNPSNWFGRGNSEPVEDASTRTDPALLDPRPLIANVTDVAVERAAGGAILRATGVASAQGYWGAELVPLAGETPVNGALVYFFRVEYPRGQTPVGTERQRTVTVARFLPDNVLGQSRSIVVRGDLNQRRASR